MRLRFSLRAFLFFVFLVAVFLATFGESLVQLRNQQRRLNSIHAAGRASIFGDAPLFKKNPLFMPLFERSFHEDGFNQIEGVDFSRLNVDADLRFLDDLPHLKRLEIAGAKADDVAISRLQRSKNLESLVLHDTSVTSAGLSGLSNLQMVWLEGETVTDASLNQIETLPALESLCIVRTRITSAGVAHVSRCKHLTRLRLQQNHAMNSEVLLHISKLETLRELAIEDCPVGDEFMEHLLKLENLDTLDLRKCKIGDAGVRAISSLQKLEWLMVTDTQVTEYGVELLPSLKKLHWLDLSNTQIGDTTLARLKNCSSITHLRLSGTPVTDAGCCYLAEMTELHKLWIDATAITNEGLGMLRAMPYLHDIGVGPTVTVDAARQFRDELWESSFWRKRGDGDVTRITIYTPAGVTEITANGVVTR